ncbi:MAG: patatin-like phospholipase family protein [Burkholderiaceae bacterium]|nr:patatin-like phospholipase family protein [Burkholderiaceae bacterium]
MPPHLPPQCLKQGLQNLIRPALQQRVAAAFTRSAVLAVAVLLAACSSVRPWINQPLLAEEPPVAERKAVLQMIAARDPSMLVAVTLSGGGARAAAFRFGVLSAMQQARFHWNGRDNTLLEATDVVSGVSGGSIVAAYFAAYGIEGLPRFEPDFLRKNFQNSLIAQALHPSNLIDLSSPWLGRSHLLARRLDQLYGGMNFGDVERRPRHPQLFITATDMSQGAGFEFTWDQFALICSDLSSVPLSFAVAASSAVPLLLSPMTLKNYAGSCDNRQNALALPASGQGGTARARLYRAHERSYLNAQRKPYIHLVDGGLADNLGVQRLLDRTLGGGLRGAFTEVQVPPGSIKKLVLITVNSERDPSVDIDQDDTVPNMAQVVDTLLFGTGARASRETQEFLRDTIDQWRKTLSARAPGSNDAFAPDAQIYVIAVNLRDAPDETTRRRLLQIPTAFSISAGEVSSLIEAGGNVLRHSPGYQALMQSLPPPQGAANGQR